jgi:hypothetical protein
VSNRRRDRERRRRLAHAEVVPREERAPRPERAPKTSKGGGGPIKRKPVPAPSIQRSAKRAALVFVVLGTLIYVVDKGRHSLAADGLQAALGAAFFVPFDFLLTRTMHRRIGKKLDL